jgi:hydrogenase maturation protease
MSSQPQPRTLFAGIGSQHGDDRIGWLVADALRKVASTDIDIREAATPSDLLDWLEGIDRLIVCDACASAPGTTSNDHGLHRWEWPTQEIATLRSASSHAFGLPQVMQLAERLGTLPPTVIVFGVAAECFDAFAELSPNLAAAQLAIVQRIAAEVADAGPVPTGRMNEAEANNGRREPALRGEDVRNA